MSTDISNNDMLAAITKRFDALDARFEPGIGTGGHPGGWPGPDKPPILTGEPGADNRPYQVPPKPTGYPNSTEFWWSKQQPDIQAIRKLPTEQVRMLAATALAEKYSIDTAVVVNLRHPAMAMSDRFALGRPWIAPLGMPQVTLGWVGDTWNGHPYDPANPPAGAILTTLDWALPYYEADQAQGIIWMKPKV